MSVRCPKWTSSDGRCSNDDSGAGEHRCRWIDVDGEDVHTTCGCPCGARTPTPKPYPLAHVKLERDGRGSVVVDGVELNNDISELTVTAVPMRGTKVIATLPHVELAAQGEIILSEETRRALTMLGWTSPEQLAGVSKAFSEAARVELQDALGGLGTVLREWPELIELVRRPNIDSDWVLGRLVESLGKYAPSEAKWSRVIEAVYELAGRMEGLEK